jgi:hypothetical protein
MKMGYDYDRGTSYENRIMKSVKIILKGVREIRKNNRSSEFNQSTLYSCVEIPH